jgi:hypothetical protein
MKHIEREREKKMYSVRFDNVELERFITLNEAMSFAKTIDAFVTIRGEDFEVVGMFGVDSVKNGVCPDGVVYDWNKASRIGRVKKERV